MDCYLILLKNNYNEDDSNQKLLSFQFYKEIK